MTATHEVGCDLRPHDASCVLPLARETLAVLTDGAFEKAGCGVLAAG
jgi:hypothetical protein